MHLSLFQYRVYNEPYTLVPFLAGKPYFHTVCYIVPLILFLKHSFPTYIEVQAYELLHADGLNDWPSDGARLSLFAWYIFVLPSSTGARKRSSLPRVSLSTPLPSPPPLWVPLDPPLQRKLLSFWAPVPKMSLCTRFELQNVSGPITAKTSTLHLCQSQIQSKFGMRNFSYECRG